MTATESNTDTVNVLVFSDDVDTRQAVITGTGIRPAADLPELKWTQAATAAMAKEYVKEGDFKVLVLDGEAPKISGMVVAKDLFQEIEEVPPIIILTGRPQDEWLATFSGASEVVAHPLNPVDLQTAMAKLLRKAIHQ